MRFVLNNRFGDTNGAWRVKLKPVWENEHVLVARITCKWTRSLNRVESRPCVKRAKPTKEQAAIWVT